MPINEREAAWNELTINISIIIISSIQPTTHTTLLGGWGEARDSPLFLRSSNPLFPHTLLQALSSSPSIITAPSPSLSLSLIKEMKDQMEKERQFGTEIDINVLNRKLMLEKWRAEKAHKVYICMHRNTCTSYQWYGYDYEWKMIIYIYICVSIYDWLIEWNFIIH